MSNAPAMTPNSDAAARFIDASASILLLRVDRSGTVLAANGQAEALIGEALLGRPWDTMLLNFAGRVLFSDWVKETERPRLLSVRTAAGLPQTLQITVEPEGDDFLLFGEVDSAEQAKLGREVLELNGELNNLSRELAQKNAELGEALREKEALIQETHHRVKNNLAMIASLMRITARRSVQEETKAALLEMEQRIQSVVILNTTLYQTRSYTRVRLAEYLRQTATHVFNALAAKPGPVRLVLDLAPVEVATAQAIPCGLLVNELITNSLKHGFPSGRAGEVRVSLHPLGDGKTQLRVSDTGIGLPEDFKTRRKGSLGLQLVGDLGRQLQGAVDVGPGATFTIVFRVL